MRDKPEHSPATLICIWCKREFATSAARAQHQRDIGHELEVLAVILTDPAPPPPPPPPPPPAPAATTPTTLAEAITASMAVRRQEAEELLHLMHELCPDATLHPAPAPPTGAALHRDVACAVCMVRPWDCCVLPCRHVNTCLRCVRRLRHVKCPICRTTITQMIKLEGV
jgi:hypothetical protein